MPIILRSLRRSLSPALFVMLAGASASAADRPRPDGLADVADLVEGSDAGADDQERLAQFNLRRRPAVKKPVVVDDKDLSKSSVNVKIDPASIDTDNSKRDDHLKSEDFFNVAKFKEMTFVSTKVEKGADGVLKITGDLTMHGVTRSVVLTGEGPSVEVKDPGGNAHVAFSASTSVKRADFGLTWNRAIEGGSVVGEDVKIELEVELFKKR